MPLEVEFWHLGPNFRSLGVCASTSLIHWGSILGLCESIFCSLEVHFGHFAVDFRSLEVDFELLRVKFRPLAVHVGPGL